ncbi:hypothetical protein GOB02_21645 [Sinorhizobium meliloti]|nr:hypothetical protein [Sinorhizobium meliloti]
MAVNFKACPVTDCNGNAHRIARGCKGYCNAHYLRFRRYGDPLAGSTPIGDPMRYIQHVALLHRGTDCLAWPFGKTRAGYGTIKIDGKTREVHRYICEIINGYPPTPDHEAAHSCGKGHEACISPGHLSWKTPAENAADKFVHETAVRGERLSKLSEAQVREIRNLKGVRSQAKIAREFGVNQSTISDIHRRAKWAWLD